MSNLVRRTLVTFFIFTAVSAISLLFLPTIVEHWLVPVLLKRISLDNPTGQLSRLTLFSATGSLSLEDGEDPVLTVPRFKLLFSPKSLLDRRIDTMLIDHGTIHLTREDGRIRLRGFSGRQKAEEKPAPFELPLLPFLLDSLVLKECSVVLHEPQKPDLRLTVTARLNPRLVSRPSDRFELTGLDGSFIVSGVLLATGQINASSATTELDIAVQVENGYFSVPYHMAADSFKLVDPGPLSADLRLQLDKNNRSISNLELRASLDNFRFEKGPLRIEGNQDENRLTLSISGPPDQLAYKINPIRVLTPIELTAELSGAIKADKPTLYSEGNLESIIQHPSGTEGGPLPAELSYDFSYTPGGQWLLNLSGNSRSNVPVPITHRGLSFAMPPVHLEAEIHGYRSGMNGSVLLNGSSFDLAHETTSVDVDGFEMRVMLSKREQQIQARLIGSIPAINFVEPAISVDDMKFNLPLYLPFDENARSGVGSLSIGRLKIQDSALTTFTSTIRQSGTRFILNGKASALFDPNIELSLEGSAKPLEKEVELDLHLPPVEIDSERFPLLNDRVEETEFSATVEANAALRLQGKRLSGSMQARLADGYLRIPDKNISLEGIRCGLEFHRLPFLLSEPSQRCTFDTLDIGTFAFSEGLVDFRVEDPRTLFIERSKVRWAQGSLESGSLRLSPDSREIDTTLYASRINFSDLLNQFGFDQTAGQGALNGKLPIRLSADGLNFDDGFLFSTPGTGGIVRFTNTDMLHQAMGAASETGYLQYSLMALKDFAYNWTRLSFNSSGDDLLMTMELDGKPRTPLPFTLKNGMITAVDQGKGLQYPIRLDVNFNMELNELLKVGNNLKSIMGK